MKLGIMCASQNELRPLTGKLENSSVSSYLGREFFNGSYHGVDTVVVMGGVGKVNAAVTVQTLIQCYGVDTIIFTGVAGGMDDSLSIGDVIIGTQLLYHDLPMELVNNNDMFPDMPRDCFSSDPALVELCRGLGANLRFGKIVTGDAFITGDGRHEIIEKHHPLCVDMESAAAAQVCWFFHTPLLVIRSLSDFADDEAADTYEENVRGSVASAAQVLDDVVRKLGEKS